MSRPGSPPLLGLGTWDLRGRQCVGAVHEALEIGYRHIDTAEMYQNEQEVGRGLRESGVERAEVFLTTKLWTNHLTRKAVPAAFDESLRRLGADYVDLLLIHWPNPEVPLEETLEAMERLQASRKARAIGVSNFPVVLWERALALAPVALNQIEYHPFLDQSALVDFAGERGLQLIAYTPIAKGRVATEPAITNIARGCERTPVQVALRWLVQRGIAAIPKAARRPHLEENSLIFDFELTDDEMAAISALGRGGRLVDPGWAPNWD